MRIGVPREIKDNEYRVGLTPAGVKQLTHDGHEVCIQAGAGLGSSFSDDQYESTGARIVSSAGEAWAADLVVKIKEPLAAEHEYLRPSLLLFTFLHLAAVPELIDVLIDKKVRAIGYETVQLEDGSLPLLAPMSQVAGRVAVQLGACFLHRENGGSGILLGGVTGSDLGQALIIGGGNAGVNAASVSLGLGARVTILDCNPARRSELDNHFRGEIEVLDVSHVHFAALLPQTDLLIGAALIPGAHAPHLIDRPMLASMRPGSVFVDVSIDQGGISETSRPTSHSEPTYIEEGVIHCCIPNLPGAVPLTSTQALTAATLPYVRALASDDPASSIRADHALMLGVNTWDGRLTCRAVADGLDLACTDLEKALKV